MEYLDETEKKGKLYSRFRKTNILLFAVVFLVMVLVMMLVESSIITHISVGYSSRYAMSSAEALGAHLDRGVGLVSKMARISSVVDWMADEHNEEKRERAFSELSTMVRDLYSNNLYVVIESSRNDYRFRSGYESPDSVLYKTLDENDPEDVWYFHAINSGEEYILTVALDNTSQRKRVWIDYVVYKDGVLLGAICTGLEFSHVMNELFSHHDGDDIRGLIIDENGVILMDSALMEDEEFLYSEYESRIDEEFQNPALISAVRSHLSGIESGFDESGTPDVVKLSSGRYRYVSITPIRQSRWSVVVLSGSVSLFEMSNFIPIMAIVLSLLIAFAIITNAANYRLIFRPLSKLNSSLPVLRENLEGHIYGSERDDELGELSRTIEDLFTKANVDVLTGIRNRRFMENSLGHIMALISRTGGLLSTLMIDIDYFKLYNDTYGHDQGDICLRAVARAINAAVTRAGDFAARYGGEEFTVILPNTNERGARIVAERILKNVRSLGIPHSASDAAPHITVSIGAATGRVTFSQTWEECIKRADEALYKSKQNGRDRYTYIDYR